MKMEMKDEFEGEPKNWNQRIFTYEYNPNIKIEAPIKEAADKPYILK